MAADLHALLSAAGIPAPYVLVGHSIGGIVARRFYARYPGAGGRDAAGRLQPRGPGAGGSPRRDWRFGVRHMPVKVAARRQARILGVRRLAARLGLMRSFDADIAREVTP